MKGPAPISSYNTARRRCPRTASPDRIEQNVQDSDATVWFGGTTNSVAHATAAACLAFGKPYMPVYPAASFEPSHIAAWIVENNIRTLNVTGNREEEEPGIGDCVEQFLGEILQQLGHRRA